MTLLDFFQTAPYWIIFHVYTTNAYDQNVPIYHGTVQDLRMDDKYDGEWLSALSYKVDVFYVCKNGNIQINLIDKYYEKRVEEWWTTDERILSKWDKLNPETRPYRYSCETEHMRR